MREETGLEANTLRLLGVYSDPRYDVVYPNGDEVQQFSICFTGHADGGVLKPDGDEILSLAFTEPAALPDMDIPVWYRTMIADALRANGPTFDKCQSTSFMLQQALWSQPGYILPAALAVVVRKDGAIWLPPDAQGKRGFPVAPVGIGESAATSAVRAATPSMAAQPMPERLLGIVSVPGQVILQSGWTDHVVATVFALRANPNLFEHATGDDWVFSVDMTEAIREEQRELSGAGLAGNERRLVCG
ncbi:MAG: hypothetical protein R3C44_09290 [Chloroflexota bacterium]